MSRAQVDAKLRAEGRCRLCLRPASVRPLTRHRIVPGAVTGPYKPVNCVPLCRPCHELVDNWQERDPASTRMYRRALRASMWPEEIAHAKRWLPVATFLVDGIIITRDWDFDQAYPRPTRELVLERRSLAA